MTSVTRADELARRFIDVGVDYTHAEIICAAFAVAGVLIQQNPHPPPPEAVAVLELMKLISSQLLTDCANETRH